MRETSMNRALELCATTLLATLPSTLAGCETKEGSWDLKDTEGRTFEMTCPEGRCAIARTSGEAPKKKPAVTLFTKGRVLGACDVAEGGEPGNPSDCRALVCTSDLDCPPLNGEVSGHCVNELCIDPANDLQPSDAVMMCLAGTGLGRSEARQVSRYAMALNCGRPCRVPKVCRQP
jgi:hypothetical protein